MFQVSIWFLFPSVWRTFISNFFWENLLTMNSLSILYTKNILKSFRSKMMYLLDIEFWFWQFFFSPYFKNNDQLTSGFLMRNPQSFKFLFHYKQHMFLSSCFHDFFSFLAMWLCMSMDFFGFILFKICWAFKICKFLSFAKSGKFLAIIFFK